MTQLQVDPHFDSLIKEFCKNKVGLLSFRAWEKSAEGKVEVKKL
jgi:hypothetical protein